MTECSLIIEFVITECSLITEFVITEFVITEFVITEFQPIRKSNGQHRNGNELRVRSTPFNSEKPPFLWERERQNNDFTLGQIHLKVNNLLRFECGQFGKDLIVEQLQKLIYNSFQQFKGVWRRSLFYFIEFNPFLSQRTSLKFNTSFSFSFHKSSFFKPNGPFNMTHVLQLLRRILIKIITESLLHVSW